MNEKLLKYFAVEDLNTPANPAHIEEAEKLLDVTFPEEYKQFLLVTNGVEGSIGADAYIALWSAEELFALNEEYDVNKYTPGLIYFGSDGGDEAYAFDKRTQNLSIVAIPFDSIHIEEAEFKGNTFLEFLQNSSEE